MVSMKELAQKCGVSLSTVSKALNNQPDISEETKKKIRKIAKDLGYYPNAAARSLKTNRTYNIGVLFVDEANSGLTHEYFSAVLEGVKAQAESQGYDITFINNHVGGGQNYISYYDHCKYRNVDGVVIACVDFDKPDVVDLMNSEIPIVTIDHINNNCTSVVSDNVRGISDLVNFIYQKGHRKIAYIHGQSKLAVTKARLASFFRTAEELKINVPEEYIKEAAYLEIGMTELCTEQLLDMKKPPTCILYPDDMALIGGMHAIEKKGYRIPEDISVVGYDGSKLSQLIRPKLTTISQDTHNIGSLAAEKLINSIENPKTTLIERVVVEGNLIIGGSVGQVIE